MTHFGLLCPPASGHLHPMTTLGHALMKRGHRVTLVGIADAEARVRAAGLGFEPIGQAEFPAGATREIFAHMGELSGPAAFRTTVEYFGRSTALVLREAPLAFRRLGVEALVIDQTSFGGATVANALDLPFVSVSCALLLNPEPAVPPVNTGWRYHPSAWAQLRNRLGQRVLSRLARPITDIVADFRRQNRLPMLTDGSQAWSPLAQICQQPATFEYPRRQLPAWFHFVGPLSDTASRESVPFPWHLLTGQPLIYASLGTIQNQQLGLFATIAEACRHLDAQLVIALGGGSTPEALPPLPGAPLVVGFAPQLELLSRAALTITHAGLNTVLESLSNGVPMVAIPIANDQPGVAARVAWTGSGAVVPLKRISMARLRAAIDQVWLDLSYRENAHRLQQDIGRAGGVARAADIVEQAITTGRPVM
ncbi:glycosyltransferase [Cyanobium sp. Morenito 9A2]|uniref:glycosyltransferase n=1 Tax=Cyanobium sp. Morenito 9A2 TaxID=2823718 RepID=UPI0020CBF85C|nr:nucleotide disphospho-sugar-binding domain-containing protein [Cyanobium sp. Morenito 9A2]MCP9848981.1 glycosyl transferase family 1 [Cyanobium sp. Morenito 9A2]